MNPIERLQVIEDFLIEFGCINGPTGNMEIHIVGVPREFVLRWNTLTKDGSPSCIEGRGTTLLSALEQAAENMKLGQGT